MKTNLIRKLAVVMAMAVTSALITLVPSEAQAQKGAGAAALVGKSIDTVKDIDALQSGDMVMMSCPKCKTTMVSYVEEGKGSVKSTRVRGEHQCPGCKQVIKTEGVGKQATDHVTHVCSKCGSDMAFCCTVKKGDLHKMEKKD
ncbi:MAG: hypothetical protein ABIR24_02455 [Verrucomicrobiota bacterium]